MASKTGKSKKMGRNKIVCAAYRNSNRREKNKARRVRRHLLRFPGDLVAKGCLEGLRAFVR
jgi:hypothetical protein